MNYTYGYDADYWNWCVANDLDPHEDASAERWAAVVERVRQVEYERLMSN